MKLSRLLALGCATAALTATSAMAANVPGLYNTGIGTNGQVLTDGSLDPHYTLNGGGKAVVYSNSNYSGASNAAFIAAQSDGGYSSNPNTYSLTFSLAGFDASTAKLSGNFEADNYASVFLNGVLIGQDVQDTVYSNFQMPTAFSANSGFVAGDNTLQFIVTDTGPPSALEVSDLAVTADAISAAPEPGAWALMFAGVAMMGALLRRRRQLGALTA